MDSRDSDTSTSFSRSTSPSENSEDRWSDITSEDAKLARQPPETSGVDIAGMDYGYDRGCLAGAPQAVQPWSDKLHYVPPHLVVGMNRPRQAIVRPNLSRCPRCLKWCYDVAPNLPFNARRSLGPLDAPKTYQTKYYACCGTLVKTHSSGCMDSMCYVGLHMTHEEWLAQRHPDAQARLYPCTSLRPPAMPTPNVPAALAPRPTFPPAVTGQATSQAPNPSMAPTVNPAASMAAARVPQKPVFPAPTRAGTHPYAAQRRRGMHAPSSDQTRNARPPPSPKIYATLPWTESSLYHPPGWVEVPAALRRPGDPRFV